VFALAAGARVMVEATNASVVAAIAIFFTICPPNKKWDDFHFWKSASEDEGIVKQLTPLSTED
jgi:hypothetical protein